MHERPLIDQMFTSSPDAWIGERSCPECGGMVEIEMTCPGYGTPKEEGGRGIYVCLYGCSNATEYRCIGQPEELGQGCGWWYRNPNKRGDKDKMGRQVWWAVDINDAINKAQEQYDEDQDIVMVYTEVNVIADEDGE